MDKNWKRVVRVAREQGWRVVGTPSDWRAIRNTITELRREGGFEWPPAREQR
ncbi:MAG TPA: hypothetical protein VGT60_04095 [Candidatus Limnocylindria bacterium]|nr:hypothetical protein [Candidatus Limnocylindria bacterium]